MESSSWFLRFPSQIATMTVRLQHGHRHLCPLFAKRCYPYFSDVIAICSYAYVCTHDIKHVQIQICNYPFIIITLRFCLDFIVCFHLVYTCLLALFLWKRSQQSSAACLHSRLSRKARATWRCSQGSPCFKACSKSHHQTWGRLQLRWNTYKHNHQFGYKPYNIL